MQAQMGGILILISSNTSTIVAVGYDYEDFHFYAKTQCPSNYLNQANSIAAESLYLAQCYIFSCITIEGICIFA
jgi:hypothetical protein